MLRKVLFWLHLTAGSVAGVVILIMSVTGVLLMYEKQIVARVDHGRLQPPAPDATRLPVETLLARVRDARQSLPSTLVLRSDPTEPAALTFGRDAIVYFDPYTGQAVGESSRRIREFFRSVTSWHRVLGVDGTGRQVAREIADACNFAFLFLVMSGFYLWWPRQWVWTHVRAISFFRRGIEGRARDFNWHNVFGLWCCVPLFLVVLSGVVMSYPWASNLVFRLAGGEPPRAARPPAPRPGGVPAGPPTDLNLTGFDAFWTRAEQRLPGWRSISLRLPGSDTAPLTFTIEHGTGGQPQKRATLTLDRTGQIARLETFGSQDAGRRARTWMRFVHTGEYYGLAGQTIAGTASGGGALLVWTGISLALRRLAGWRKRRPARAPEPELVGQA